MKLGYSTWGMPSVPFEDFIPRLAWMGYTGIELAVLPRFATSIERLDATARHDIRFLLDEYALDISSIAPHSDLTLTEATEHAISWRCLTDSIDLAVDISGDDEPPVVCAPSGGRSEDWESIKTLLAERLGELCAHGEQHGVRIACEPHYGHAVDRPERMLWLIQQVSSAWLRVNVDYSQFLAHGWSLEETVPPLLPWAAHTHVKGVRGVAPDVQYVVPGEDDFDYARYLRVMAEGGYEDYQTVEVSVMVQRRPDYDPFCSAQLGYDTMTRAFQQAGLQ